MNYVERFRVSPGDSVKLKDIDPRFKDDHDSHKDAAEEIEHYRQRLRELQELLYADGQRSLLLCLQALDAGGKDGTINHILGSMNPQGCKVVGFKQPSADELAHDFLWRIHLAVPARGEVTIFNRSHYEDVLIARVHNLVPQRIWSRRYDRINAFESGLVEDGTHILKFYLHISKEEQLKRFKDRLDDPPKQWKISEADYKERTYWDQYMTAYEEALSRCSTAHAPWFIIPADRKWFRNLAVARIVVEHLEGLKMTFPPPSVDIQHIRKEYHSARAAAAEEPCIGSAPAKETSMIGVQNREAVRMKTLIVFDLDGTIAQSKSSLDAEMAGLIDKLLGIIKVAVISGGNWPQFQKQVLAHLTGDERLENLSLLPTCGTQYYKFDETWTRLYAEDFSSVQKEKIISALQKVIVQSGAEPERVWGETIEDRGSQITFSALGQQAPLSEKEKWDPTFAKRKKMLAILATLIPEFSVRLGGSTSIDVTKPGIDKAYGIKKLRDILGVSIEEMIFVGDALFPGGNDYPAEQAGVDSIRVRDPHETKRVIETILACLGPAGRA